MKFRILSDRDATRITSKWFRIVWFGASIAEPMGCIIRDFVQPQVYETFDVISVLSMT